MEQMGEDIHAKVEKNAFRVFLSTDSGSSAHLGSYPEAAKFNHDCRPK